MLSLSQSGLYLSFIIYHLSTNMTLPEFLKIHTLQTVMTTLSLLLMTSCAVHNKPQTATNITATQHSDPSVTSHSQEPEIKTTAQSTANSNQPIERQTHAEKKVEEKKIVWELMRNGFKLQDVADQAAKKRIQKEIDWYLSHPNYIKTVNSRSKPYITHILSQVSKRQLPHEIALLPFVESGFDAQAHSYASAVGLWQFMPKTGKSLGLQQDWWKDDRRDIVLSTDAALTYLQMLNKRFKGNWLHALAAYNSGAGNVSKAIRKNKRRGKPTSYWHLDLPKETEHYVPKLLAITHIYNNPEKYNVSLEPIQYVPYFETVNINSQLDLFMAAKLANVSIDELMLLNPSFNQFATHPEGPHLLLIPKAKVAQFNEQFSTLPIEQRVTWHRYKIKKGDSLSVIARKHKVSVGVIQKINTLTSHKIRAGKTLLIPNGAAGIAQLPSKYHNRSTKKKVKKRYIVKSGDSLWKIAREHNIKINHITRWNNLSSKKPIKPGQKLTLWLGKA